jgi:hypothetical protein
VISDAAAQRLRGPAQQRSLRAAQRDKAGGPTRPIHQESKNFEQVRYVLDRIQNDEAAKKFERECLKMSVSIDQVDGSP